MSRATLSWVLPTTRVDGSALDPSEILAVDILDNTDGSSVEIGTATGAATSFVTDVLSVGSHSFSVIVRDTTGHSSAASVAVNINVPATLANPSPATDLTAVLDQ